MADDTITSLDLLEVEALRGRQTRLTGRLWAGTWPKLAGLAVALAAWQAVVWSGWKPEYALPGPAAVGTQLLHDLTSARLWHGMATTGRRAVIGFTIAVAVGLAIGLAVARTRFLRAAVGSLITALQTMPSIAWFPLAILMFQLTERAILFVVVLGAAPSIANGVISGVDYIPPLLLRAGSNLGARGLDLYRHVIAPAALPAIVAGLKQGWAFAWRSLMAGELLVVIAAETSLGAQLSYARELSDAPWLISTMIVILLVGLVVDGLFGSVDRMIRTRWGIAEDR